jgi:tetraacyldisaccharide 4'-kinase
MVPEDFYSNHEIYTILLFTGIAYSKPIVDYLKGFSQDIKHLKFADHSEYTESRLKKILKTYDSINNEKKIIITTEKDAIKIREISEIAEVLTRNMFYLPIEVKVIEKEEEFNEQIMQYVRKNKRNS